MAEYYLIDLDRGKKAARKMQLCEVAAKLALKYGSGGPRLRKYKNDYLLEFWPSRENYPSVREIVGKIKVSNIKWYIYNKLSIVDEIWNPDFIYGISKHGTIVHHKRRFSSFVWHSNKNIKELIEICPFGGRIGKNVKGAKSDVSCTWFYAPVLSSKHSDSSASFFAGLLSVGILEKKDGYSYVKYKGEAISYLKKWKIPIEYTCTHGRHVSVRISSFWPALFALKMPEAFANKWLKVKRPFRGDLYSSILWKVYVDNSFPKNGLPFLPSRRTIYYRNECEEGAMKKLERLRVQSNLVELPNVVREVVQLWAKKQAKKQAKNVKEQKETS